MEITKKLTKVNFQDKNSTKRIKYIVIHYVGATGGAKANCDYFYSEYRGVSAHYFVGHKGEIWQCVDDADIAWHCGGKKYVHKYCRNSNSIGIEMCCRKDAKGNWYFEDATVKSTVELVQYLMKKYNIKIENVIRHYDVTGKKCPEPYVNEARWANFKNMLITTSKIDVGDKVKLTSGATYYDGKTIPAWVKLKTLYVRSMNGDRVVISTQRTGAVTGAVHKKYLKEV
jgi:N-acetyl-anhydromuramyl-L-alanine amidase AmpD